MKTRLLPTDRTASGRTAIKQTKPKSLMNRVLTSFAVLSLAAMGIGAANANDLFNPDLDQIGGAGDNAQANPGPVGWQIIANETFQPGFTDGADSETFCNVQQPGGYGLFFKPFHGQLDATNTSLDNFITVDFYQDNPSTPGTKVTLSGYAAGEPNFCAFQPPPPGGTMPLALFVVEFLDGSGGIIASNAFDLVVNGLPNTGTGGMIQMTTPQYTAPAGTATVRAGAFMINAYSTSGQQSFFVDAFDLESVGPPGSPVITNQPTAATVGLGGTAHFTVGVSNSAGATYQWQFGGANLVNGGSVSGATDSTLTISGASTNDVGHYRVLVANSIGSVYSTAVAPLAINGINFFPTVVLTGTIGDRYAVQRATTVTGPYISFTTNKLTVVPQYIVDFTLPVSSTAFYKEVYLP
jgi:Immunoglobulin domain